jgi:hypothetical protein
VFECVPVDKVYILNTIKLQQMLFAVGKWFAWNNQMKRGNKFTTTKNHNP